MLSLFIVDEIPNQGEVFILGDEAHHAASVIRVSVGDEIMVTDGHGSAARVRVSSVSKKSILCEILSRETSMNSPTHFTVIQALTKGDRARETIELLTEAGVNEIVPWSAQLSIGQWRDDAQDKWQLWAREATKQSRRNWIPKVASLHNTKSVIELIKFHRFALVFHESSSTKLSALLSAKSFERVLIVIGPEGGLTEEELSAFASAGGEIVGLGKPVFRSAHAGAAALAAVQTALGIW